MKKILFLMLSLSILLCFASCVDLPIDCISHEDADSDGKCDRCEAAVKPAEKPAEPEVKPEEKPEAEGLVLVEGGEVKFNIVVARGSSNSIVQKAAKKLTKALEDLDMEVKQLAENADNATDCEVFLGAPTTRGDEYAYDIHELGPEGYAVKIVGKKVIILGGSNEALALAVDLFIEDFLGIDKKTKELDTVVLKAEDSIEEKQDNFRITSLKLEGEDMKGYTISSASRSVYAMTVMEYIQELFYQRAGYWLPIVSEDEADKSIIVRVKENSYEGDGFSITVNKGSMVIETEFPNKLEENVADFFASNMIIQQGDIEFTAKKHNTSVNVRDLYYEDFGAKSGDGKCDFAAMRACHEYANQWGHFVKAKRGAEYYIGTGMGNRSIEIKTDTDWNGCRIIIDDNIVDPHSIERESNVFKLVSDVEVEIIPISNFAHVTKETPWVDEGDNPTTNIGWAPGEACMLKIISKEVRQFVRYGPNEDTGNWKQEIILVDAEGNIDPTTPLQWPYQQIDNVYKYSISDRPISVGNAVFETIFNNAPSEYTYYGRNIGMNRSNATVHDLKWEITGARGDTGAPYSGLVAAMNCHNATVRDYTYEKPPQFYTATENSSHVVMGTYGLNATSVNLIIWDGINQTDIRDEQGAPRKKGATGSNYCKNMMLKNSKMSLFDAHKGTYNATLVDSEVISLNMIGEGRLVLDNVRLIGGDPGVSIGLRQDYGASWEGSVELYGCTIELTQKNTYNLFKSGAYAVNWDFGYTCYFPQEIIIEDLKVEDRFGNERTDVTVRLSDFLVNQGTLDWSKSEEEGGIKNPYMPTKSISIKNSSQIKWVFHNTPMFKDMKVYFDGVEIKNWKMQFAP